MNSCHKDNIKRGMGITDMTMMVLAQTRVGEAAQAQKVRRKESNVTARQNSGGVGASLHAGGMQDGDPEKYQWQQQPKPKPKLPLKQKLKWQHESKPKQQPTPARRCETVSR